jgi:hypothetical protein
MEEFGMFPDIKLFPNVRGNFWAGKPKSSTRNSVTLENPRRVECGLYDGASDILGSLTISVWSPSHDNVNIAVPLLIELKRPTGSRTSEAQKLWRDVGHSLGCISGVVKSAQDLKDLINKWLSDRGFPKRFQ